MKSEKNAEWLTNSCSRRLSFWVFEIHWSTRQPNSNTNICRCTTITARKMQLNNISKQLVKTWGSVGCCCMNKNYWVNSSHVTLGATAVISVHTFLRTSLACFHRYDRLILNLIPYIQNQTNKQPNSIPIVVPPKHNTAAAPVCSPPGALMVIVLLTFKGDRQMADICRGVSLSGEQRKLMPRS